MDKKIFNSNFLTSLFVLLISFVLVFVVLFNHSQNQLLDELSNEAGYISYAVENEGVQYINNFKGDDKRITLVAADGTVLVDTSADERELDNHADRQEIKEAILNGSGTSTRFSDTMMKRTVYYAVRLSDGSVLRVSATQDSVFVLLLSLVYPLSIIIIVALVLSLIISHRVSKSIIKPINELDLDNPAGNESYEELTPLLKKISAQKRTIDKQIKAARQRQEEFRLITENMSEGLLVTDANANVLSYNKAALHLLEIDNIKNGGSVLLFNRTKGFRELVEKVLSGNRAEKEISHDSNIYNLIANPVYEGEKVIGAVIVIIDITESVHREQLRREFTSNVSHELKTPLTSISGFAEMMKSGGTPDDTVVDFSGSIYDEAQRLITLVTDIIKISELDENPSIFEKQNVDLYALSQNVIKSLKPLADKHNISLNLTGDTAYVLGTPKIVDEMIYNLCDNAIKYNKENGNVDIIITATDNKINLTVRDTGIGIPMSEQSRVFERFYRVDKSHSKQLGGTGLGLAIVKHAAAYTGAEINLESMENVGTSVTVSFDKID
ncbi:MAG: histidine kinase [Clostridia bacterium]|nr:histidine kinase [Clostridia bacterium]